LLAVAITAATAVVAAVTVAFTAAIAAAIGVTIASNNPIFWRAAKNTGLFLRPQTSLSYLSQKKQRKVM